ncbi:hypothetical protein ANABIO32_00670 [Rossellomorea marisflavi]|jgi:hypothetical protein|uniref:hypothetical protein n=1 Tax=Rossellomorea marisflavi TaxID=189381 RepID=UPI0025CB1669|nr:hypothetical protein [Rossellomorea marisflavi]GLI82381.1 hypothetical protein ANABIO32_00670 [Rossellomorea marisflavi]
MKNTLKELQMGYLYAGVIADQAEEGTSETCSLCWNTGCNCGGYSVAADPFINLTAEEIHAY